LLSFPSNQIALWYIVYLEIERWNTSQNKSRSPAIYALLVWMVFNAIFYLAELTIFKDAADLNNSIMFVLWVLSIMGFALMKKWGAVLAAFTLSYAFAFNVFNVIYFYLYTLKGTSAIINGVALIVIFIEIFSNKFH
jgi:hypothetical protein